MAFVRQFLDWFWNPDIWLPAGIDWVDLKPNEKVRYTSYDDLKLYPIPAAICLVFLRILVIDRYVLIPLGQYLGLRQTTENKYASLPKIPELEVVFRKHGNRKGKISDSEMSSLMKKTDMSVRQIERWLRRRAAQNLHSRLSKFCDSGYRFICYVANFAFGLFVLYDKPWTWDNTLWYINYPHHSITDDIWWYYMAGMAIYISLLITHFVDVKRKDFYEMFVHHLTTLTLLSFSWVCNWTRIGAIVLVIHDCSDVILEFGKMSKYAHYDKVADVVFVVFTLSWIATRLMLYPSYVIYSALITAPTILAMFPVYYIFNTLLIVLLLLHVFWTYFIMRIAVKAVVSGEVDDARSVADSSESDDDDDDDNNHGSEKR